MFSKPDFSTKQWIIVGFFIILVAYSLFQARFLILGPRIKLTEPANGANVQEAVVIRGIATNAAWLSLNGRQIFTDEKGHFEEKLIVPPGPSIITVRAKDRFGREREKRITIFNPSE